MCQKIIVNASYLMAQYAPSWNLAMSDASAMLTPAFSFGSLFRY